MDVLAAMERNIVEHAARLGRGLPGARLVDGDVVIADSGLAAETFNAVVATRFEPATADRRIAEVTAGLRAAGRPFVWVVGPASTPPDLSGRLAAAGVPLVDRETAMALPLGGFTPPPAPAELEIRTVGTAADRAGFAAVIAANWDPPEPTVDRVLSAGPVPDPGHLIGYVEGRPVCTALLVEAAGVSGLYMVCTLVPHRGRGYGTAVTAAALALARSPVAVLQASTLGEPVYRQLGFTARGEFAEHAVRP
jgi:GNAT superfamily N-acetyltransferase